MLPRWLITFRAFALACAFAAAFVPIATYITDDKRDWLWIHIGVNIAAYIAVALTTIYTTVSLTQQDHNKYRVPAYWANNVVMRTWYLGVSKTWRWHVAAAVGRLGLALALAQHVHIIHQTMNDFQGILAPFYYVSHVYTGSQYATLYGPLVHSHWATVLLGCFVLIGFSYLETGALAALTLLTQQLWKKTISILPLVAMARLGFIITCITVMAGVHNYTAKMEMDINKFSSESGWRGFPYNAEYKEAFKYWHKAIFAWLDDGTMTATWIMRPISPHHACAVLENSIEYRCLADDTMSYIITDMSSVLAASATYILAIGAALQLAHYLHWRREQQGTIHRAPTDRSATA